MGCGSGHSQDVKVVRWHPGGELLVSAGYDDTIRLWTYDGDEWGCSQTLGGEAACHRAAVARSAAATSCAYAVPGGGPLGQPQQRREPDTPILSLELRVAGFGGVVATRRWRAVKLFQNI
ncbi:putative cytosolic iron-sulfur protein assembly protein CIAO1 [Tetrabaena socialis]|uniref:Putative cytosolic iron-sulfur protein assembly protein CIAO1 n=1 Tax=Tetrabaena socialis TaxID=47790 RepID=A0A2J8ADT8_9CHLO|nr:putative cytosolic iron-sulfur protein assembly protein CIAO1 [Tetrabaena socialis]|eukprot:PNH10672.1 putative cytosolic iron-sulfur protein assembly protein CIAO1 [Tetrabaena socialis]